MTNSWPPVSLLQTGKATFSFDQLAGGKLSVFLVLPNRHSGPYSTFYRLMVSLALEAAQRVVQQDPIRPTAVLIEQSTGIGRLEDLERLYGLGRTPGLAVWSFFDNLAQLQRDYPNSWRTFLSGSTCVTVTGIADEVTTAFFSDYTGIAKAPAAPPAAAPSAASDAMALPSSGAPARPSAYAVDIRNLKSSLLYVLMPSTLGNYFQHKLLYYKDHRFNGMYRPLPRFADAVLPGPYPYGPYAQPPLLEPKERDAKRKRIALYAALGAFLFFWLVSGFGTGLVLGIVAFVIGLAFGRRKGKPGEWWIERHDMSAGGITSRTGEIKGHANA